mgnify:CR=1 FL=1
MDKLVAYVLLGLMVTTVYSSVQLVTDDRRPEAEPVNSTQIQAKDLALSGIEYALMKLDEDRNWASGNAPEKVTIPGVLIEAAPTNVQNFSGGEEDYENSRFITSSSYVEDASATVKAIVEAPVTPGLPESLKYALFSGSRLSLDEQLLVLSQAHLPRNTNVHTNSHLSIRGISVIEGFGTYSSTLEGDRRTADRVFVPNLHTEATTYFHHPSINPPAIDTKHWQKAATRTYASSTMLSRDQSLGTKDSPGVWLIKGHLDLRACLTGTGILLVEGDLRLYGKSAQDLLKHDDENLCIVVAGDVFAEDAKVSASIVCGGSFRASGSVIIVGSLLTHGEIQNVGTLDVYYRPLPFDLASRIWTPEVQPPHIVMLYD